MSWRSEPLTNRLNFIKYAETLERLSKIESRALNNARYFFKRYPGRQRKTLTHDESTRLWREKNKQRYQTMHREANQAYRARRKIPKTVTLPGGITMNTRAKKMRAEA